MAVITRDRIDISRLKRVSSTSLTCGRRGGEADRPASHITLKEIHEQPEALRRCITGRLDMAIAQIGRIEKITAQEQFLMYA